MKELLILAMAIGIFAAGYFSGPAAPAPAPKPVMIDCGPLIQKEAELAANQVREEFSKRTKEFDEKLALREQSKQSSPLQCTCHGGCNTHCNNRLNTKGK